MLVEILTSKSSVEIDIAAELDVAPSQAVNFLIKKLGDSISKDEIIAKKQKGLIFKKIIEVKSLLSGKVFELDNFSGKVKIVGVPTKTKVASPVNGKIISFDDRVIHVEFKGEEISLKKSFGSSFFGETFFAGEFEGEVDSKLMTCFAHGKIIVGGHFSLSDLNQAMAVGAKGILAREISDENYQKFIQPKIVNLAGKQTILQLTIGILKEGIKAKACFFEGEKGRIVIPRY